MHPPGLEPGSTGWKPDIIPLDQGCLLALKVNSILECLNFL